MKILLTTLLCLCLSLPVLADQQTTVLTEQTSVGKATATLPYIDGSNSAELEKQANALVRDAAALDEEGHIIIDALNNTSVPGIFAAGDVSSVHVEQVPVSLGEGAKAAISAWKYLAARND